MKIFLHGLDSSSNGTKGRYFKENYPQMLVPDFEGSLQFRLHKLEQICQDHNTLTLVGSSFGGLMAACFATTYPSRIQRLILMAPALNFPGFLVPKKKLTCSTYLLIGKDDDVTPPSMVLPLAEQTFLNLETQIVDEDHLLHQSFPALHWESLLGKGE